MVPSEDLQSLICELVAIESVNPDLVAYLASVETCVEVYLRAAEILCN